MKTNRHPRLSAKSTEDAPEPEPDPWTRDDAEENAAKLRAELDVLEAIRDEGVYWPSDSRS